MDTARRALMAEVASLPRSAGRRWTRGKMQGLLLRSDALFAGERDFSGGIFTGLVFSGDLPRLRIVGSMVVDVCSSLCEDVLSDGWVFSSDLPSRLRLTVGSFVGGKSWSQSWRGADVVAVAGMDLVRRTLRTEASAPRSVGRRRTCGETDERLFASERISVSQRRTRSTPAAVVLRDEACDRRTTSRDADLLQDTGRQGGSGRAAVDRRSPVAVVRGPLATAPFLPQTLPPAGVYLYDDDPRHGRRRAPVKTAVGFVAPTSAARYFIADMLSRVNWRIGSSLRYSDLTPDARPLDAPSVCMTDNSHNSQS